MPASSFGRGPGANRIERALGWREKEFGGFTNFQKILRNHILKISLNRHSYYFKIDSMYAKLAELLVPIVIKCKQINKSK